MAVTFDAGSVNQADGSGASSLTISHTVGSGSDRALVVLVHSIAADKLSAATVTWNGSSMGSAVLADTASFCYAWVLVAPASGTFNAVITFNSGGTYANAAAVSFAGVDQTTPVAATPTPYDNGFATSPRSLAMTIPTDGAGLDLLFAANASTTLTPTGSGQTAVAATQVNTGVWSTRFSYLLGAASSMDWTFTGSGFQATHGALALNPAAGGGGGGGSDPAAMCSRYGLNARNGYGLKR